MKIKDNEKIKKIKEKKENFDILWSNPRYKAIIKLSIWFSLILVLSLIVRLGGSSETLEPNEPQKEIVESNPKQQLNEINSYEAIFTIETLDLVETLTKKVANNKELISYQNNTYYYDTELKNLTTDEYNDFVFKTLYFNTKNIYSLIENIEEEYTTKYKDGSYITNYKVPTTTFIQAYNNSYIETTEFIDITIEGNQTIEKITINLNDIGPTINIKNIIIELNNVNNIEEIDVKE